MAKSFLSIAPFLCLTGCAELLNIDSFKDAEGGSSTSTESTANGGQGGMAGPGGTGGTSNGGGGAGGTGGSIPLAQCSTTPSIIDINTSAIELRARDFNLVTRPGQNKPINYGVVTREDGGQNVHDFVAFSMSEQQTPRVVTFSSTMGGLEVSHVDFAQATSELVAYVRNGTELGEVRWRTNAGGLDMAIMPTFTPYVGAVCPVDTYVSDFKMQMPNAVIAPRFAYVCRANGGADDTLRLGTPTTNNTIATGQDVSAGYFGKSGSYDVLFSNGDSATSVRVGKTVAELGTTHPLSLENDPMRATVLFSAYAKGPMETKYFFATLKKSGFVPGRIFQRDIDEVSAPTLTQSPQPGFTQIVELSSIENLVRWFPLVASDSYLAGAGVSFEQGGVRLTLLNKAGDVLVLNHDVYTASGTDEILHVAVAEPDGAQFRVVFIEKSGAEYKLRARVVTCVGGV